MIDEIIIYLINSDYGYVISNYIGLVIPACICAIVYVCFYSSIKEANKIYGATYLISLIYGGGIILFDAFSWTREENGLVSLHFIAIYPIVILLFLLVEVRTKGPKRIEKINLPWMYIGTLSSMALADFCGSFYNDKIIFTFDGIGGAGVLDGLVITPLLVILSSTLINRKINTLK